MNLLGEFREETVRRFARVMSPTGLGGIRDEYVTRGYSQASPAEARRKVTVLGYYDSGNIRGQITGFKSVFTADEYEQVSNVPIVGWYPPLPEIISAADEIDTTDPHIANLHEAAAFNPSLLERIASSICPDEATLERRVRSELPDIVLVNQTTIERSRRVLARLKEQHGFRIVAFDDTPIDERRVHLDAIMPTRQYYDLLENPLVDRALAWAPCIAPPEALVAYADITRDYGRSKDYLGKVLGDLIPGVDVAAVLRRLDSEIGSMSMLTRTTHAGITGGGVGRVTFEHSGKSYVFKLDRDDLAAYKDLHTSNLIYAMADTNRYARQLARRKPRPLGNHVIFYEGFYMTLHEDRTGMVVQADADDLTYMEPALRKDLPFELVDHLYITALFHVVMTPLVLHEGNNSRLARSGNIPTNLPREELTARFQHMPNTHEEIAHELDTFLRGYEDRCAWIHEAEKQRDTAGHYDNKPEHYQSGNHFDNGCVKLGFEVDDLARALMGLPGLFTNPSGFRDAVDAYVVMRKQMDEMYTPQRELMSLVWEQAGNNALRNAGWALRCRDTLRQFGTFWQTAGAVYTQRADALRLFVDS